MANSANDTVVLEPDSLWVVVLDETSDQFEERIVSVITARMARVD